MGKENFVLTHGGKARSISWWEHSSSSVRECIRLIIEAGLDWSLITEPEISEKIDEETQTRSITIVLNNSRYLKGTYYEVDGNTVGAQMHTEGGRAECFQLTAQAKETLLAWGALVLKFDKDKWQQEQQLNASDDAKKGGKKTVSPAKPKAKKRPHSESSSSAPPTKKPRPEAKPKATPKKRKRHRRQKKLKQNKA